jgi:predicted ester cyclase
VAEENRAVARKLIEQLFNTGHLEIADEILAADYVDHSPSHPGLPGPENLKLAVAEWRVAFPDTRNVIEDMVAEGDKVAVRWTTYATHRGGFMGIAATGNRCGDDAPARRRSIAGPLNSARHRRMIRR